MDAIEGGEQGGHTKGAAKSKKKNQNDDSSNSDDFDEDAFVELEKHWQNFVQKGTTAVGSKADAKKDGSATKNGKQGKGAN